MPSSIARLIATDHERMLRLIRRTCTSGPSQQRWRDELARLVRAHHAAEAETLTPEILASAGADASVVTRFSDVGDQLVATLTELETADLDSSDLDGAGGELVDLVTRHADLLAAEILEPMTRALPRRQMRELGGRYAEVRDEALVEEGADEPPPRRLDVSRAELYELAKRAGIEGRSSMSRRDLIVELQRRQQTF